MFCLFVVCVSCDCLRYARGVVIDEETRLPIEKAMVINETDYIYTDSLGRFEVMSMTVSLCGCPKMKLSFEKEGYEKVTKKYHYSDKHNIIVLKKQTE